MVTLGSTFEDLLDPVTTGGEPVEMGFTKPFEAGYLRDVLSGEARLVWLQKSKTTEEE